MTFAGRRKRVVAEITSTTSTTAEARVPAGATDGKVRVKDNFGNSSSLSAAELVIRPRSELGSAGDLEVAEAETSPRRAYYFGVRYPRLTYVIRSDQRLNDLRIDVVGRDGSIVRSFFRDDVAGQLDPAGPLERRTSSGKPARNGAYSFRIRAQSGARARRSARRLGDHRLQALRLHLPGPGPPPVLGRDRRPARRPHPPGPGRGRRLRDPAASPPAAAGSSTPATRAPPATTS